jgi:hypothetical protein
MMFAPLSAPASATQDDTPRKERGTSDPCARRPATPGLAKGLEKRCEPIGGGSGVARGDFNGDTIGDLAIGVPDENVNGATDAGAVNVIYGSAASGLTSTGNQFFHQDSPGVAGAPEAGDRFGLTLAAGDFNGDGFSDLAIGVPFEDIDGSQDEGLVQILHGSPGGLVPVDAIELLEFSAYISVFPHTCRCRFGGALAWGDFNGDSVGDLAIGMPRYTVITSEAFNLSVPNAGAVVVLYGELGTGLSLTGEDFFGQGNNDEFRDLRSVGDSVENDDHFGAALAAGDHDGDGYDDLAIGVPQEDINFFGFDEGMVHVVFGTSDGLRTAGRRTYVQGRNFVSDSAEFGDQFGNRLAMGDFNGVGDDEVIVGVPYEDIGSHEDAGAVFVLDMLGQGDVASEMWHQDNIPGAGAETGDHFGWAVAAGDFNGDGREDLAIGVPDEDFGNPFVPTTFIPKAGLVHVLYGSSTGVSTSNAQIWRQDTTGIPGDVAGGDQFGYALSAWNFGRSSHRDLAIGIPGKNVTTDTTKTDAGAVVVIYGSASRLTATGSQQWTQASAGILDAADSDDRFGGSLY